MLLQDLQQFADSSVDAVTCTFGLMFMPNWQKAVKEVSSV
jgi:ubiquinone/menaquinone biosynthesis C-methylase UbiE